MTTDPVTVRITPADLFFAFTRITLTSFGGALFWSRRALVERYRWLTEQEFVEQLALAQLLPGANGLNLAVCVGYRFAGWRGAAASLTGFLLAPCVVIMALGILHAHYGNLPLVKSALAGMSAVAVGLLLATALRVATVLGRRWRPWALVALAFIAVGVMRWPFLAVLAVLAPVSIFASWKGKL
jgi:chromate transporter